MDEACKQYSLSQSNYRFSRREVREAVQWSDTALKVHMARLVELEYLLVHRGRAGRFDYELLFDGQGEQAHLMGLIDVEKLSYGANRSGQTKTQSGCGQPLVSDQSEQDKTLQPLNGKVLESIGQEIEKSVIAAKKQSASYRSTNEVAV